LSVFPKKYSEIEAKIVKSKGKVQAVAYLRTSSAANASIGNDKDSDKRQRAAVTGFAKANGYEIVDEYYDVVSGADPIGDRPGFKAMLNRIAGNGVRVILVESPDRFARDLAVQLAGHDYLRALGVDLIPASAPDFFLADTPTAVLVRQVLGAISEFEKTSLVAKLKAARDRKRATGTKVEGRKSHAELRPEVVALAKQLRQQRKSLRQIAAELATAGHVSSKGKPFVTESIKAMIEG
jgi:DNA invertase Pin-like site-specific DNA recombinase